MSVTFRAVCPDCLTAREQFVAYGGERWAFCDPCALRWSLGPAAADPAIGDEVEAWLLLRRYDEVGRAPR